LARRARNFSDGFASLLIDVTECTVSGILRVYGLTIETGERAPEPNPAFVAPIWRRPMNRMKKTVLALATLTTVAIAAAAPAQANHWKKPFVQGLGFGVGLGITSAILSPKPQTIVVQQPGYVGGCTWQQQQYYDAYGVLRIRNVQVCY
jgi:hypothetical protein